MRATIFKGGPILTMDGTHPDPELVVIGDDRIIAVGDAGLATRYPDAHTVELNGRTLSPGFIDAYNHLCIAALHPRWADLSEVATPDARRAALGARRSARRPRPRPRPMPPGCVIPELPELTVLPELPDFWEAPATHPASHWPGSSPIGIFPIPAASPLHIWVKFCPLCQ